MKKSFFILAVALLFPLSSAHAFCVSSFCLGGDTSTKPSLPYSIEVEVRQSPFQYLWERSFLRDFNRLVNSLTARPTNPADMIRLNGGSVPLDSYYTRAKPQQDFLQESQQRVNAANQNANNTLYRVLQNPRSIENPHVSITPPTEPQKVVTSVSFGRPDLWVGAWVENARVAPGSVVTYHVTVQNNGDADATNVYLTPSYDLAQLSFRDLHNGSWFLGTIPMYESREFSYVVTVSDGVYGNMTLSMTAKSDEEKWLGDSNPKDNTETISIISSSPSQGAGGGCDANGNCWSSGEGGSAAGGSL